MTNTKVYRAWVNMKLRTKGSKRAKEVRNYQERGITVCPEWQHSFETFYRDIGEPSDPRLTLERIDNNRGYEPGNCKWDTYRNQALNRRKKKDRA